MIELLPINRLKGKKGIKLNSLNNKLKETKDDDENQIKHVEIEVNNSEINRVILVLKSSYKKVLV